MDFSSEQKAIINAEINNILVSASAGSGKTTVLTARIGDEIKSRKLSVDSMLVVTFTEDAAAHMADKIEERLRGLRKDAKDEEEAAYLSKQIDMLPNAYIQTMHGFCSRVIKEKGYLLESGPMAEFTDPTCRIISESEQDILLQSAVDSALKDLYKECESSDDPFIEFTRRFGDGRNDKTIIDFVKNTYQSLRSLPDYLEKCDELIEKRERRNINKQIMSDNDFNEFKKTITDYLSKVKKMFEDREFDSVLADHEKYRMVKDLSNDEFINEVTNTIGKVLEESKDLQGIEFIRCVKKLSVLGEHEYSSFYQKADLRGDDKPMLALVTLRHFVQPGKWNEAKYNNCYDLPEEYIKLLSFDPDTILPNQIRGTETAKQFVRLLKKTDEYYLKLKGQMHGMDFSDLEHTAYEILKCSKSGTISEAALFYQDKFIEIFVDEYQDNTNLQDAIIDCFDREDGNVFRVGDVKQSIYKFRYADPEIFMGKMKTYENDPSQGQTYYLKENHRSSCKILAFANYVFEQIMSGSATEIEYGEDQRLKGAKESDPGVVPRIIIADKGVSISEDDEESKDKTNPENRAIFAAVEKEVKRYLEECPKPDGNNHDFKDICILTSSNNQAERIARYLNNCTLKDGRKIKASGRFTTDVFEDMDIHRLINLLICLGNAYRDEYLASVLFSNYKFSNFTVEEIARIQAFIHELEGVSLDKEPLMLRLKIYAEKSEDELAFRVKHFVDVFEKIRMNSMVADIDDIIELVYRETGIKATLESREADSNKFDIFKDWLSENFKRRGSDISGIAEELEQMKIQIKSANIEIKDADKNKITTMTVHKSKGLEFPFVILIANGGSDEMKDNLSSLMFDRKEGFITEDYDSDLVMRSNSFEQYVYKMKMDLATTAETCRLLYVALTRAEENLSIISVADVNNEKASSPVKTAFTQALGYEDVAFDKRHWLAGNMKLPYCLFSALARSKDGALLREIANVGDLDQKPVPFHDLDGNVVQGFEVVYMKPDEVSGLYDAHKADAEEEVVVEKETPEFDSDGKLVIPEYKYQQSVDVPFKVTVTGLSDFGAPSDTTHVDLQVKDIDDFESVNVSMLTGAAKGTILHRIMRFIDLEGLRTGSISFEFEIESMINDGYLNICSADNAREVASEFKDGIMAFCNDDRCNDIVSSFKEGSARSEKPIVFSVFINGDEGDSALVQGIIDLIYKTSEGYTILDYKTDHLGGGSAEERAKEAKERHAFQLDSYAAACEEDGVKVAHKLLYLVRYGEFVEV